MQLTDTTFKKIIGILRETYAEWKLSNRQESIWRYVLASKVSNELLPIIVSEWISNESKPPKTPADLVHYLDAKIKRQFDSADVSAELIISSARNAYYSSDDFEMFTDMYSDSFAAVISGMPAQEAYIKESIREHSSNPKVLIFVYDELKGEVEDCYTGDAEHGVEFLRNHIKKSWNAKIDEVVKDFLVSGNSDFSRLAENHNGFLES